MLQFDTTIPIIWAQLATEIALVAACIALVVALKRLRRQRATSLAEARRSRERLIDAERVFQLAEDIAGVGVWQYFPKDGRQIWSKGLREMFGIEAGEQFLPGDGDTLLNSSGIDLVSQVMARSDDEGLFTIDMPIIGLDGARRNLMMRASHIKEESGLTRRVIGVVMDVTEQAKREQSLLVSRDDALREAREAQRLANTDPLTGLANRRQVMGVLDRNIILARRNTEPLAVIVLDIDHFKRVNDTHGHLVGDKVLCRIAGLLQQQARGGDVIGRIGGEEFVWVAPGADNTIARILSERARQAIAQASGQEGLPAVTVSAGFAEMREKDTGLKIFARADEALYLAKQEGRNRVRMAA